MAGKAWGRREDGHYDFLETEVTGHLKGLPNWSIFISLSLSLLGTEPIDWRWIMVNYILREREREKMAGKSMFPR